MEINPFLKKNKVDPTSAVLLTPIFENQEPNKFKKKEEITLSVCMVSVLTIRAGNGKFTLWSKIG